MQKHIYLLILCLFSFSIGAAPVWKVSKGENHVFIGGTVHFLSQADYPLPGAFEQAYKQSDILVFETDLVAMESKEFQPMMMDMVMLKGEKTVKDYLTEETYNNLSTHLAMRGLPIANFLKFKPGFLAITLSVLELQMMGLTSQGVDAYYTEKADVDGKRKDWFETPKQQLQFLVELGKGKEDSMIAYTLEDLSELKTFIPEMIKAWSAGDMQAIDEISNAEMKKYYPDLYQLLLVERNQAWMPKIETMLSDSPVEYILVGTAHLAGEESVLKMLLDKGYTVEKLP